MPDLLLLARSAHEANRVWCEAHDDTSQVAWEHAPAWQRKSAVEGVKAVLAGTADPEALHAKWAADKRADGWTYGPVKDPENKLHPCLVPYADLPPEQRAKDKLFAAVVLALRDYA